MKKAVDTFGKTDVLINNAGIVPIAKIAYHCDPCARRATLGTTQIEVVIQGLS